MHRDIEAYKADNRISLAGTSDIALEQYLSTHTKVEELVFCLDSDDAGRTAAIKMARGYADKGYITRLELPIQKDYNEVLLHFRKKQARKRTEEVYE